MAEVRRVAASREYVDHDHGHWCNTCKLSTGIRVWLALHTSSGTLLMVRVYCYECEGHDVTVVDDAHHC